MERLSDWRAAAWLAFCLAAVAAAAAVLVPAALHNHPAKKAAAIPALRATLTPRTHLFAQPVTATIEVPAGSKVLARFTPYRLVSQTSTRHGRTVRYEFRLDCLRSGCVGRPGAERTIALPPVAIKLPDGRGLLGMWPGLRQASRLMPHDLVEPQPRAVLEVPVAPSGGSHRTTGLLLAIGAGLALLAAGAMGLRWLSWRPSLLWSENGRHSASELDYALIVAGLAAGGAPADRRAALESLASALDQQGHRRLALEARSLAWSPRAPRRESLQRLAGAAQQASKERT